MWISPGARVYLTTGISLAAVAVATWTGMMAGAAVTGREWWTLGAAAASVTAAGVPAYEQIRKERLRAQAEQLAVDVAVAMRVTMNDALDPIVRQLGRVVTARTKHEREALQEAHALDGGGLGGAPGRHRAGPGLPVPVKASSRARRRVLLVTLDRALSVAGVGWRRPERRSWTVAGARPAAAAMAR